VRFQRILEHVLNEQTLQGGASAMTLSDCACIDVHTSLRAARVAFEQMLLFNKADVPVRIGLGRRTFYGFKYSVDVSGADMVAEQGPESVWDFAPGRGRKPTYGPDRTLILR
jgi:hypothetical protein